MMDSRRVTCARLAIAVAVCFLVLCTADLPAGAQLPQGELLDILEQLPAAERAEMLRGYGLPPTAVQRDVSTPELIVPREPQLSSVETQESGQSDSLVEGEVPKPPPLEPLTGAVAEITRAFRTFLAESQPLQVREDLQQFGYDLFAGAPTTFAPATDIPVSSDYIIGPGDEVHVQLY
ncbi:MAG: hypothetical protein KAW67_01375, partial [Candidatus Eisenbacteria sp.]|nr:hypothetical protein [Candidatus Eisenbacteria bacterium]